MSDGVMTPKELVAELYSLKRALLSQNLELGGFSVCDHQTFDVVPLVIESLEKYEKDNSMSPESRLRYLIGVELAFSQFHLTAYFPRIGDESNMDVLKRVNAQIKPDKHGLVLITDNRVDKLETMVSMVHEAKGIIGLAHPTDDIRDKIQTFVDAGIDAIEAYNKRYTEDNVQSLLQLASEFGLLPTGGSDFHYPDRDKLVFAPLPVPFCLLEQVEKLADARYGKDAKSLSIKMKPREELALHNDRRKKAICGS